MECILPNDQDKETKSNFHRVFSDELCEWKWCCGMTMTGTLIARHVCAPFKYRNRNAQCCCTRFPDNWKNVCLIVDVIYYIIALLLLPIFVIFAIIFDIIQIILGFLCCLNLCCQPCYLYGCCELVSHEEHNERVNKNV